METDKLSNYIGGWFIGNFDPSMLSTDTFEISVKRYQQGDIEAFHYQLSAIEFTVIVSGQCRIGASFLGPDDIIRIDPFESADFEALTDVVLVAVKTPSIPSDKILGQSSDE
jgi:hypothetical protein